jgi:hypothetical protein
MQVARAMFDIEAQWHTSAFARQADIVAAHLTSGNHARARDVLLGIASTACASANFTLALSASRAARLLADSGMSGELGAELMKLGDQVRQTTDRGPEPPGMASAQGGVPSLR